MRAIVLEQYTDKNTKVLHKVGEIFEVTEKRCEEINSTAYGIFLKPLEEREKSQKKKPKE